MPGIVVWLVIAVEFVLPLLLVLGIRTRWVALALMLYTIATACIGHRFWTFDAATQYPQYFNNLTHFLKNLGIAGGFALLAMLGPGRYAVEPGR
jgi:putative oxidoreductase